MSAVKHLLEHRGQYLMVLGNLAGLVMRVTLLNHTRWLHQHHSPTSQETERDFYCNCGQIQMSFGSVHRCTSMYFDHFFQVWILRGSQTWESCTTYSIQCGKVGNDHQHVWSFCNGCSVHNMWDIKIKMCLVVAATGWAVPSQWHLLPCQAGWFYSSRFCWNFQFCSLDNTRQSPIEMPSVNVIQGLEPLECHIWCCEKGKQNGQRCLIHLHPCSGHWTVCQRISAPAWNVQQDWSRKSGVSTSSLLV